LTFNGLHGVISQKMVLFITTAVRTSDPTLSLQTFVLVYPSIQIPATHQGLQIQNILTPKWLIASPCLSWRQFSNHVLETVAVFCKLQCFSLLKTETNCWTTRYCAQCAMAVADVVNSFVDVAANIIVFKFDGVYHSCVQLLC
jgi:hypothetical protein